MTLEEIKAIAETWFDWPEEDRCHITYTSAMLFARDMYERGQKAEREKYQELIAAAEAVLGCYVYEHDEMDAFEEFERLRIALEKMKNDDR